MDCWTGGWPTGPILLVEIQDYILQGWIRGRIICTQLGKSSEWWVLHSLLTDQWADNEPTNQSTAQPTDCYTWVDSCAVVHATKKLSFFLHEMHGMSKKGINQFKSYKTHLQSTITPKWCKSLISCKSEVKELIFVCILNPKLVTFDAETSEKSLKTHHKPTSKLIKPTDMNLQ